MGGVDKNRFGVPDKTPGITLRTLLFKLSWLGEAEYEDTVAPLAFWLGTSLPLYCCFDPAVTPWRQNRTYMGILDRAPFAQGATKPRTMATELQIKSLIYASKHDGAQPIAGTENDHPAGRDHVFITRLRIPARAFGLVDQVKGAEMRDLNVFTALQGLAQPSGDSVYELSGF